MPAVTIEPSRTRPKRLIICCDGTWQSSVSGIKNIPSNVTRLARSFAREGIDEETNTVYQQLVHYDAGIGTGELSKGEKDRQGGFGVGFLCNVIEAYNFLVLNYSPGDKVYCFGFSRGAYTARAVAGLVNDIGIITPRDMQDFPDLFTMYLGCKDSNGFRRSKEYREWVTGIPDQDEPIDPLTGHKRYLKPRHTPVPEESRVVEVVGVFDTVGSLGIPETPYVTVDLALNLINWRLGGPKVGFHNVDLSPYIRHAFHALALDEHRGPFTPTLWHLPASTIVEDRYGVFGESHDDVVEKWKRVYHDKDATDDETKKAWKALIDHEMAHHNQGAQPKLKQVWFPGVHINVGGGSDDMLNEKRGDLEQIALISFAWMCEQISPMLQLEDEVHKKAVKDRMSLVLPVLSEIAKGETKDYSNRTFQPFWKALDYTGIVKAEIKKIAHEAVHGWATGPIIDSYEGSVKLAGSKPRTPGRYTHGPATEEPTEDKALGPTNEEIHPSVYYRMQKLGDQYSPEPLRGFKRKLGKHGFEWVNGKTGLVIPEYEICVEHDFSHHVASEDRSEEENATKFIKDTQRALAKLRKGRGV